MIETTTDDIVERIREIDGQLVLLDVDLADFYGVSTAELRAVVSRNQAEFPMEFVIPVVLGSHDEAVHALDATIREQFTAIYEALGMSVTAADPDSSLEQKLH